MLSWCEWVLACSDVPGGIWGVTKIKLLKEKDDYNSDDIILIESLISYCDAPKPGGPLTARQPAEYKWRSGYPTPL